MKRLILPADIFYEMLEHCIGCLPDEGCGILAGNDSRISKIYKMTNTDSSPVSYMMDPSEQFRVMKDIRKNGLQLAAIFHSHPVSEPRPSQKDRELAFYDDAAYVIVGLSSGLPHVRAYMIKESGVSELPVEVI
ncbi:MAG: M67 family metallopeptidase [Nitrospiraceae bacterium]|nr:M67 family metallopeptidase [Nitrospiraceae bacterium]